MLLFVVVLGTVSASVGSGPALWRLNPRDDLLWWLLSILAPAVVQGVPVRLSWAEKPR